VVTFAGGEDEACMLCGFTIAGGSLGIYCYGSSPTLSNCTIDETGGTAIDLRHGSDPVILNCEISGSITNRVIENVVKGIRYDYVQDAIAGASDGNEIVLSPGVYEETLDLLGKNIVVRSEEPNDSNVVGRTIIRGNHWRPAVCVRSGEEQGCVLDGLTISDGNQGVFCDSSTPTIRRCILTANSGAGFYGLDSSATVVDCNIFENQGSGVYVYCGAGTGTPKVMDSRIVSNEGEGIYVERGIVTISGCSVLENKGIGVHGYRNRVLGLENCIIAGNGEHGISGNAARVTNCTIVGNAACGLSGNNARIMNSILWDNLSGQIEDAHGTAEVSYSDVEGGWAGLGNIDINPHFCAAGYWDNGVWIGGDCHLKSAAGRWDAQGNCWVCDAETSPCIDTGNPIYSLGDEPINGGNVRINMGAYGWTVEASKCPAARSLLADVDNSGLVDYYDLEFVVGAWLSGGEGLSGDFDRDGFVDLGDFCVVGADWLCQAGWLP
jgi:hypothetical protein